MASLYEAWKRWGEKPKVLEDYDTLPSHFGPAIDAFNFLKQLRPMSESGPQPIPLTDVQMYICGILRYSDPNYVRWMVELVVACDSAERQVIQESLSERVNSK